MVPAGQMAGVLADPLVLLLLLLLLAFWREKKIKKMNKEGKELFSLWQALRTNAILTLCVLVGRSRGSEAASYLLR